MKPKFKAVSNLLSALLLFLVLVLAFMVVDAKMKNKPLFLFGHSALWVLTDSMEPDIPAKSYILIREVTADEVKVGDIITFYSDDPSIAGNLNTHRVEAISPDGKTFTTKGTNPRAIVDPVPARAEAVVGRYQRNLPLLSHVVTFLLTKAGLAVIFAVSLLICASFFLPSFFKKEKTEEEPAPAEKTREELMEERVRAEVERMLSEEKNAENTPPRAENHEKSDS